tara:strand:- start:770 stop:1933 length:1164 start_codon:yes stop_codon:yes gene_type:complete
MKIKNLILIYSSLINVSLFSQSFISNSKNSNYQFSILNNIEANNVDDQGRTSTCWSFSALSFFESEIMRIKGEKIELSEMFIVRNTLLKKAEKYVRMHGNINFGPGGAFHDVIDIFKSHGIVPNSFYNGNPNMDFQLNHAELDNLLLSMVNSIIKAKQKSLTPLWKEALSKVLDVYLGELPNTFEYKGKKYNSKSFFNYLNINSSDYVSLTSFTHHPYYEKFIIEVPDNWLLKSSYNLKLNELIETMYFSLENGFSIAWGADVSENGFSFKNGLAIVPDEKSISESESNIQSIFESPCIELSITPEIRQLGFDNYETTDDHGMHITGVVKDQKNNKYFIVKNSWGITSNECDGYFYASEEYIKYKTINILLHKEGIPKKIKDKLKLK